MKPRSLETYDAITRRTVLEPDGSVRPDAREASTEKLDHELQAVVADVLLANGMTEVGVEVDHGRIILRGWVRDAGHVARIVRTVAKAAPDADIDDRMHVGPNS